jgi:peroxiredoxin family protein
MTEEKRRELTMIVFSGDMDKLSAAFSIATGAAASDMTVTMFFTFWGFRAIKNPKVKTGKSILAKMMGMIEGGGIAKASPSKYSMCGMGRWMFKKMMGAKSMPSLAEQRKLAIDLGVNLYACQQTMDIMEIPRESLIDEVKDVVGVAFMLEHSKDSFSTLFI